MFDRDEFGFLPPTKEQMARDDKKYAEESARPKTRWAVDTGSHEPDENEYGLEESKFGRNDAYTW